MRQSSFIEDSSRRMSNIISGKINTSTKPNGKPVFSRETPLPPLYFACLKCCPEAVSSAAYSKEADKN
jgi:hypothetical protein